jgi:hypothetical protein
MRIEDTIKVNKNDCEVLTKSCKDIIIIWHLCYIYPKPDFLWYNTWKYNKILIW